MKSTKTHILASISLLIVLSGTLVFSFALQDIEFNYDFESFFPENDEDLRFYQELKSEFGEQNDFLFLAIKAIDFSNDSSINALSQLEISLEANQKVIAVQSIFDESIIQITPFGNNVVPLISRTARLNEEKIEANGLIHYLGTDGQSLIFIIKHLPFSSKKEADAFYFSMLSHLNSRHFDAFELSGKVQMQHAFTEALERELKMLLLIGISTVILLLIWIYRSPKGLILPLIVIVSSVIWLMGVMALTGKDIDVMIVMLPVIVIILSLSDVIHFINKYDYFLSEGQRPIAAIISCFKTVGKATLITSVTTSIGFLGLYFLPVKPIKDFGLYAAIGVMVTYILTILIVPALLVIFPGFVGRNKQANIAAIILKPIYALSQRKSIIITFFISSIIIAGTLALRQNTGLIVGLQKNEPMLEQVAYFDQNFGGYRPLEIALVTDELFNEKHLRKLEALEGIVKEIYGVKQVLSPLTIIRKINAGLYGGAKSMQRIPRASDISRVKRIYFSNKLLKERSEFDNGQGTIRLLATTQDLGSSTFLTLNQEFKEKTQKIRAENFKITLTGSSFLIDKTSHLVSTSVLKGLCFAIITVGLIMLLLYRNIRVAGIVLFINLMPLLMLFGIMGILSIELNLSTAIIFTVAFGIAVDDSIHFVTRFMHLYRSSQRLAWSIEQTQKSTGHSILITTLVMFSGFATLLFSGFSAVYFLGLFICLMALLALWFDLKILPILLSKFV